MSAASSPRPELIIISSDSDEEMVFEEVHVSPLHLHEPGSDPEYIVISSESDEEMVIEEVPVSPSLLSDEGGSSELVAPASPLFDFAESSEPAPPPYPESPPNPNRFNRFFGADGPPDGGFWNGPGQPHIRFPYWQAERLTGRSYIDAADFYVDIVNARFSTCCALSELQDERRDLTLKIKKLEAIGMYSLRVRRLIRKLEQDRAKTLERTKFYQARWTLLDSDPWTWEPKSFKVMGARIPHCMRKILRELRPVD